MGSTPEQVIRLVGTLGLIVGGALLVGRLLRRSHHGSAEGLRVVGRLGLGKGAALLLVAVGERRFLVGTGERGPRLLAELDRAEPAAGAVRLAAEGRVGARRPLSARDLPSVLPTDLFPDVPSDLPDGPGTGLVEQLRRMTLRTSGRSRAAVR